MPTAPIDCGMRFFYNPILFSLIPIYLPNRYAKTSTLPTCDSEPHASASQRFSKHCARVAPRQPLL